jgi:cysteinyl-tRNA synthetase
MDYSADGTDAGAYLASQIKAIRDRGKIVLAYLSIGEAEKYRFYWQAGWVPGNPAWLGPKNPQWPDNYKVRYWYAGWWTEALQPYLDRILNAGFDGVYLDIIDAYWYWHETGVNAVNFTADKMVELVEKIAAYTRASHPGFILCPQNGESIIDDVSMSAMRNRYFLAIDAVGVEDLFYHFGNLADQRYRFQMLRLYHQAGKKIFNIEYLGRSQWSAYLKSVCAQPLPIIPYAGMPDRALDELIPDFPRPNCGGRSAGAMLLLLP